MMNDGANWQDRNVMVGVLHSAEQLDVNLAHRFYHIPVKLFPANPEEIEYAALYQSRRLFGAASAGVRFYGKITACKETPRGEITELPSRRPEERYYRFSVARWEPLDRAIRAQGAAPGVHMRTTLFLLKNSSVFPELYIQTEAQYLAYRRLRRACIRTMNGAPPVRLSAVEGYAVMVSGFVVGVYTPNGGYEEYDFRQFYSQPCRFLQRMLAYIQ